MSTFYNDGCPTFPHSPIADWTIPRLTCGHFGPQKIALYEIKVGRSLTLPSGNNSNPSRDCPSEFGSLHLYMKVWVPKPVNESLGT